MDLNAIAGMIFTLALAVIIGGFFLLRPFAKRMAMRAEGNARDRYADAGVTASELNHMRQTLQSLESELAALTERQNFVEQLLAARDADTLPIGGRGTAAQLDSGAARHR